MGRRLYIVAAAALALAGCGEHRPAAPPPQRAPTAGRLEVRIETVADLKPVPAVLTTRRMAEARARIAGVLVSLAVKEGDSVREGQLVARVRDERLHLETGAYDAQVRAAAAEAERARTDLARVRTLYEKGVYAKARLDQVEAQSKAADAALAAARAQRGASAELADQGAVLAPAAGRVLMADVPVGSVVMPGQAVATITAGPPVVRLELPEADAGGLRVGDKVQLDLQDLPGSGGEGVVVQVYPAISGGQVRVDVSAANLPQGRVGQRVRAKVKVGERQAIVIPRRYISTRFGVDFVQLVRSDGSASETPVQTAPGPTPDAVEVLSGLRAGDTLALPAGSR